MDHRLQVLAYEFIKKTLYPALLFVLYDSAINGYFHLEFMSFNGQMQFGLPASCHLEFMSFNGQMQFGRPSSKLRSLLFLGRSVRFAPEGLVSFGVYVSACGEAAGL